LFILLLSTIVCFTLLGSFIVYFIVFYNNRRRINIQEQEKIIATFHQEILKTQLEVQEQTMQTIGADLHDNIGQLLSLTSLTLNSIELDNEAKARQKINDSIDLTLRSIKEMRLLGHLLQGDQLVALGLSDAIRQEIAWMERSGRYEIIYTPSEELPAVNNPDKDLIIFRIVQEIFNNIMKHAAATQIQIVLDYLDAVLQLSVIDNGVGFVTEEQPLAKHGMGLQNIRKRAGIIGGEATIVSSPGEGSRVTISIPYP
jgi:two-component system NarL family sensor kinase